MSETGNTSCCDDRHDLLLVILTGEFGVVYKAHLMGFGNLDSMTTVAVKTIKGITCISFLYSSLYQLYM